MIGSQKTGKKYFGQGRLHTRDAKSITAVITQVDCRSLLELVAGETGALSSSK